MSVTVSQKNRAVSQDALEAVATARSYVNKELFAMPGGHNILNGTYKPFTAETDSGWWGRELSDAEGYLPSPEIFTASKRTSAYKFTLAGINDNYPVDFTLTLYLENEIQKIITRTGNHQQTTEVTLEHAYDIDAFSVSVTRISKANDVLKVSVASFDLYISNLMKQPGRTIHGRVEVTYRNALADSTITVSDGAHAASGLNLGNDITKPTYKYFKLYDNKLNGTYKVASSTAEVGWWPKTMPGADRLYATPQVLTMAFSQRNLYGLSIAGDAVNRDYPVDFSVKVLRGSQFDIINVVNNRLPTWSVDTVFQDVTGLEVTISKVNNPSRPAIILEIPITSTIVYEDDGLIDISVLEELSYEDAMEKLGGVSANELTVNFDNEDHSFYFNNPESTIASQLKKNRRIRAWLGIELPDRSATIWETLGTYWTYSWEIPVGSLIAKATAFDTIGLLGTKNYFDHYVYRNRSIGQLIDIVLTSAKSQISFLEWYVEPELYQINIPVAWFEYASYAAALNRIASCDFVDIYCARDGSVQARYRIGTLQAPDDAWSDSTNLISKTYPTMYTDLPNYLDVFVTRVTTQVGEELVNIEDVPTFIAANEVRSFFFSSPAESIASVQIESTAVYSYEWFSWGIRITFTSSGILSTVKVIGTSIATDATASVHMQDTVAIEDNGVISCEITSDFIQTTEHATRVAAYIYDRIPESKYDVEVEYRGDTALTLNNKIQLTEGIAHDNLYFIKRHELFWNGSLHGSARLNT